MTRLAFSGSPNYPQLCGNCAQNFYTLKLGEIFCILSSKSLNTFSKVCFFWQLFAWKPEIQLQIKGKLKNPIRGKKKERGFSLSLVM